MIPFPEKKYSVIYADPPWNYAAGGKTRNVERHYRTMKPEDIYSLPVQDIAEDDCLLFLWATFPNLDVALETIRRWGFQYKTAAFVWVKRNRKSPSWFWGLGNWTRANAEICLLATKGKPKRASASVSYTHLDVYKRQGQHRRRNRGSGIRCGPDPNTDRLEYPVGSNRHF